MLYYHTCTPPRKTFTIFQFKLFMVLLGCLGCGGIEKSIKKAAYQSRRMEKYYFLDNVIDPLVIGFLFV